jgi:hypothetical protein
MYASTLSELLDRRKAARSTQELEKLCEEYGIKPSKLESLARFVNSPSINSATIRPIAGKSEEEGFMATVCVPNARVISASQFKIAAFAYFVQFWFIRRSG